MNMRKMIAPFIIIGIIIIYFIFMILGTIDVGGSSIISILGVLIYLILIGFSISILIERIKEIRSGEKDDLGKY